MKAIQTELGDGEAVETDDLRDRMEKTPLNDEARQKYEKELERLARMAPGTPDAVSISCCMIQETIRFKDPPARAANTASAKAGRFPL